MFKYHGTPITPRTALNELVGRNFCVSYARPDDIAWCDDHGQSVMLDNGAFSVWRQGRDADWPGYYRWCERWLERNTTWAVIPDVIEGGPADNDALVAEWPFGDRGAPVWHMHEPFDRLRRLCGEWPLVCVGSSAEFAVVASPPWHRRMRAAFDAVHDEGRVPRLHMLRGLDLADGPYPFYSADSTNVARSHNGVPTQRRRRRSPRAMADEFDGRNPPALWTPAPEQESLLG